jgi:hypothetical protein
MADAVKQCVSLPFFNLNEVDISKWKDRKTGDVIILPAILCLMICQDLNRGITYLLIHCDAARLSATPGIMKRVDPELYRSRAVSRTIRLRHVRPIDG